MKVKSRHKYKKQSVSGLAFDIFNYGFIALFCLIILLPFWNLVVLSLISKHESLSLGLHLWPEKIITDAYMIVFRESNIAYAYFNTISRAVLGTALSVAMSALIGYPLSKNNLPGRNIFMKYFLIPAYISGGLIPTYLLIRGLGLINNRLVYVLPIFVSFIGIVYTRNYIMSLDKSLEESAIIDGANYLQILFKVIIPLSKPILATVALWEFVGHWNAWYDCYIYIMEPNKEVLQVIIQRSIMHIANEELDRLRALNQGKNILAENVKAATVIITIGPIILLYPFVQKYFVKGIMAGAVKG